jgi:hypothetical protein
MANLVSARPGLPTDGRFHDHLWLDVGDACGFALSGRPDSNRRPSPWQNRPRHSFHLPKRPYPQFSPRIHCPWVSAVAANVPQDCGPTVAQAKRQASSARERQRLSHPSADQADHSQQSSRQGVRCPGRTCPTKADHRPTAGTAVCHFWSLACSDVVLNTERRTSPSTSWGRLGSWSGGGLASVARRDR